MSSASFYPQNKKIIERLLSEIGYRFVRDAGREASRTRALREAVEAGFTIESDLRGILAEHVRAERLSDTPTSSPAKVDFGVGANGTFPVPRSGSATSAATEIRKSPPRSIGVMSSRSPHVIAAVRAFLDACQKEARPPKTAGVAGSLRRAFPDLDISDADLADAIIREVSMVFISAAIAGSFSAAVFEKRALDVWEYEGGAIP